MLTGRRYLLAFTDEQAAYADTVGSICRAVWNTALEQRREYRRRGAFISYVEQAGQMAEAKQDPACTWLADAPSHTLQQTLRDLPPVGVDWGVKVAVATSDGDLHDRTFATPGETARLKRLQQRLSRSLRAHGRNRRSKRRDAVRAQLGWLNARIRARRVDFAAQTAVRLVRNHGLVAVEDLRVRNMTTSAKGTVEQPGRQVRQKAGLNRAILAKGWGGFLHALEHKARYNGSRIVKVNPAFTSLTCNACKHVARENRESQAVFRCVACGHQDNADVNAAKNIRERGIELVSAAGLAVAGRGDLAVRRSAKRQPPVRLAA